MYEEEEGGRKREEIRNRTQGRKERKEKTKNEILKETGARNKENNFKQGKSCYFLKKKKKKKI